LRDIIEITAQLKQMGEQLKPISLRLKQHLPAPPTDPGTSEPSEEVEASLESLKESIETIGAFNEKLFEENERLNGCLAESEKRLLMSLDKKADFEATNKERREDIRLLKELIRCEDQVLADKLFAMERESGVQQSGLVEKMSRIERETVWRVDEMQEKLKLRPTEEFIKGIARDIEANTQQLLQLNVNRDGLNLLAKAQADNGYVLNINPVSSDDLNLVLSKVHSLENQ
jgi:hypothetical protein